MPEQEPGKAGNSESKLPPEYLTVEYLPPTHPGQKPIRAGERRPDDYEQSGAADRTELPSEDR
jgi:hypothetical protein